MTVETQRLPDIRADRGAGTPAPTAPELRPVWGQAALWAFVVIPFLALIAGVCDAAVGNGISGLDVALSVILYAITGHGVTIGFHRYLTHGSFKAKRPLRIALATAGSMSAEGSVISWVADHRRHHAFSDRDGDPHSPWRFGTSVGAVAKGLCWAHLGWLFDRRETSRRRFAPDLLADPDIARIDRLFPLLTAVSLLLPGVLGWLLTGFTWSGAWHAFLWAGLVRIFVLNHATYSINSVCHVLGSKPFVTRDKSTNVWPLAILSLGESWHNLHHADPTCARHGVDPGQLDSSAAVIRGFERLGWVWDVRWPDRSRQDRVRATTRR